ncbi:MAG: DeoR/GlpR transcriptional regulator [Alphaproteobacteria bacterium]|nr:DeoR/GlpR transcriptional regulator [Alphaproteobacteria bacterium]
MEAGETNGNASPRQRQIVDMVGVRGFVPIDELARHFRVTAQTIRTDVNRLCRDGMLRRYHGGVGLLSTQDNATFAKRRVLRHAEKARIAGLLAGHVPDQASLFLHYGTTMQAVAAALARHRGLLVVTNNVGAVATLRPAEGTQILLVGGRVSPAEQCTQGEAATSFIDQFNADFGLLSVGSVGPDGTLYEFGYEVAETARAIMANSKQVYLAVDGQKFERKGLVKIGHIGDVSALFTDRAPPAAIRRVLKDRGVALHVT